MASSIKYYRYNEPYQYFLGTTPVSGYHEILVFKVPASIYGDMNALQKLKLEKESKFGRGIKYIVVNKDTGLFQTEGDLGLQNRAPDIIRDINPHSWEDWELFYKQGA
jgi:hypothetical protein